MSVIVWKFIIRNQTNRSVNVFGFQLPRGQEMDLFDIKYHLHESQIMQSLIDGDLHEGLMSRKIIVVEQNLGFDFRYPQDQTDVTAELNEATISAFAEYVAGITTDGRIVRLTTPIATDVDYRKLIYFVDDGPSTLSFGPSSYKETLGGVFPTSEIWWASAAKLIKIAELIIVRDSEQKPTTETWKIYSVDGLSVLETITDTYTYSGPFESSRTRSIT